MSSSTFASKLFTATGVFHEQGKGSIAMLAFFYCEKADDLQALLDSFFGPFLAKYVEVRPGFVDASELESTFAQLISPLVEKKLVLIQKYVAGTLSERARVPSDFAWYTAFHLNYPQK